MQWTFWFSWSGTQFVNCGRQCLEHRHGFQWNHCCTGNIGCFFLHFNSLSLKLASLLEPLFWCKVLKRKQKNKNRNVIVPNHKACQACSARIESKRAYHYTTGASHLMRQSAVFNLNQWEKSNITGCQCSSDLISETGSMQQTLPLRNGIFVPSWSAT